MMNRGRLRVVVRKCDRPGFVVDSIDDGVMVVGEVGVVVVLRVLGID